MEGFTAEGKAVGIVLDMSLHHDKNGLRLFDTAKSELVKLVCGSFEEGVDSLYLYHPDITEPACNLGEMTCHIGNHGIDGTRFNLYWALEQTLYVVGAQPDDMRKYVIFITDRCDNELPLEKLLHLNRKERINAEIVIVGIGLNYNKNVFSLITKLGESDNSVKSIHVSHPSELHDSLIKETAHEQELRRQTTEQAQ